MAETKQGACPKCLSRDSLATVAELVGLAPFRVSRTVSEDGSAIVEQEHHGTTEVDWDTSGTVGLCCRACLWEVTCSDYLDHLIWVEEENGDDH